MARKTNDQLEKELQEKIDTLANNYVELIAKSEEPKNDLTEQHLQNKADTKKQLEQARRDLSFIKSLKGRVDKKAEKEKQKGQKDFVARLKEIKTSIGELIADIPKSHEKR